MGQSFWLTGLSILLEEKKKKKAVSQSPGCPLLEILHAAKTKTLLSSCIQNSSYKSSSHQIAAISTASSGEQRIGSHLSRVRDSHMNLQQ